MIKQTEWIILTDLVPKMKKCSLSILVIILTFFIPIVHAQTGTITVVVTRIKDIKGQISIGLFSSENGFPEKGKEVKGKEVKVTGKTINYTFKDIPDGIYAIAVFHDSNNNGILDKNFLGIPKEGNAFSNNVTTTFGPPSFEKAKFELKGAFIAKIEMQY